ncbi:MAG: hypothetical protein ABFD54_05845 [Armatimonadota bacterium]|nr:hypothetical protein [bacterium]
MDDFFKKLSSCVKQMRAESTCPVCGKPREGVRRALGSRVVSAYDETGSSSEQCIGGYPESYESAGLCLCERVYFYRASDRRKIEHPAQGGIITGIHVEDGKSIIALDLIIEANKPAQRFTAADFDEPVKVQILAPDQHPETVTFKWTPSQLKEVA